MGTLRRYSSRATITPSRFVVEYHWGDFKGDAFAWMEEYFDAFLYFANWGTHELMLRLPKRLLNAETARRYCVSGVSSAMESGEHVILSFTSEDEGGDWLEEEDDGALASILPVRAEIAGGDLRALYLAWILAAQNEELDDDATEPPVPPGLGRLSAAQEAFCDFLRIDRDWIEAAAERSPPMSATPDEGELRAWVAALHDAEKTDLLVRVAQGHGNMVGTELVRRLRERSHTSADDLEPRTVAELWESAERRNEERRRAATERAARERARAEAERAAVRARYLDDLASVERQTWARVDELIATKQPQRYDEAVRLLVDLRDLAARDGRTEQALTRIEEIRARHEKKPSFLDRLAKVIPSPDIPLGEAPDPAQV
ncbi:MAG TPA: hypothetical protein VF092_14490 [Longimicrobium sp.]